MLSLSQYTAGGKPDGDPQINPYYRYGGLWKNHNAQVSGKKKMPKVSKVGKKSASAGSGGSAAGVNDTSGSAAVDSKVVADGGESSGSDEQEDDADDKAVEAALSGKAGQK